MTRRNLLYELRKIIGFTPKLDGMLSAIANDFVIDLLWLDIEFGKRDQNYNPDLCRYGEVYEVSKKEYITVKFGPRAAQLIEQLSWEIPQRSTPINSTQNL